MALAPWGPLGAGNFKSDKGTKKQEGRTMFKPTEAEINVSWPSVSKVYKSAI